MMMIKKFMTDISSAAHPPFSLNSSRTLDNKHSTLLPILAGATLVSLALLLSAFLYVVAPPSFRGNHFMAIREMVEGIPTTTGNGGQSEKVSRWVLGLPAGPLGGGTSVSSGTTSTRASLVPFPSILVLNFSLAFY